MSDSRWRCHACGQGIGGNAVCEVCNPVVAAEDDEPANLNEHLCFIWCDGKVNVERLASKTEAEMWHQAQAAIWHLVDASRNAGSIIVPANETWHDVQGKDGIPGYVAIMVRSYLTKSMPDRRYFDRCVGVSPATRAKADAIGREVLEAKLAQEREQLRQRWPAMSPAFKSRQIASVHWETPEAQQLAADACASPDPEVILSLMPGMEVVEDCGWTLRRGSVRVRLYCAELPRLSGQAMTALATDRELRWPSPAIEPESWQAGEAVSVIH